MSQFYDGRSVFERPSLPQPVWFTTLPQPFDPDPVIPPVYQEMGSFRSDQEELRGVLDFLDQPTHIGIFQNVLNFFEAPFFAPSHDQTQSFRVDDEAKEGALLTLDQPDQAPIWNDQVTQFHTVGSRDQSQSFRVDDEPKEGVLLTLDQPQVNPPWRDPLGLWDLSHYAATTAQTLSFRSSEESFEQYSLLSTPEPGWIFTSIPEFNAAFQPAFDFQAQSFRSWGEELEKETFIQPVAEWKTVLNYWEGFLFPPIYDFTQSFRANDEETDRTLHEHQQPSPGIWQTVLNLWDVQHYAGTSDQTKSFRVDDENIDRHLILNEGQPPSPSIWQDVLNFFEAPLFVSIHDQSQSFRTFERVEDEFHHVQEPPQPGWLFTSIPAPFDAAFTPTLEQHRSFRVAKNATDFDEGEDWQQYELLDQPSQAWIFENIPAVFDAAFWPAIHQLESYQTSEGFDSKTHEFLDQPQAAWIFTSVPAFATVSEHELWGMIQTSPLVMDLTSALPIDITTELSALGPTIVCTHIIIEEL